MNDDYTKRDLMIAAGAREIHDDDAGLIGVGLPLLAAMLAKRTHAPDFNAFVEIGLGDPLPREKPLGVGDVRLFHNPVIANSWSGVMMKVLQRGDIDVGFLGALQVDMYGNVNTTLIGDQDDPDRRFGGSGGGNDVASNAGRFFVILPLERRRFPASVDYITSPGFVDGRDRDDTCLPGGGPEKVITDKAIFSFEEDTHRMQLHSVHPGETVDDIRSSVAFDLIVPDTVGETPAPSEQELEILREIEEFSA